MERARAKVLKEERDSAEREALLDKIKDGIALLNKEMTLGFEKIPALPAQESSPGTISRLPSTSMNPAVGVWISPNVCLLAHRKVIH